MYDKFPRTNDDSTLSILRRNTSYASVRERADTDQALLDAARNGDAILVKEHLDAGANINARGRGGWTPLMYAAGNGHTETAQMLIDAGADPDKADTCGVGWRPIHHAAANGHADLLQLLLDAGADIYVRDTARSSAAHYAASEGHTDAIKALLDADPDIRFAKDGTGMTVVHYAAASGQSGTLEVLLEDEADTEVLNASVELARKNGHDHTAELLSGALHCLKTGWKKTGDDEISHTLEIGGRKITEVFNFEAGERITFSLNPQTGAETLARERFKTVSSADIQQAAAELLAQRGTDHTGRVVVKEKSPVKIGF